MKQIIVVKFGACTAGRPAPERLWRDSRSMATWVTREIQKRHGRRPVPVVCSHCGLTRPSLETFPTSNVLGIAALAWVIAGRGRFGATGLDCPCCGQPMSLEREVKGRRPKP